MPRQPNHEREIFGAALDLTSPEARTSYLLGACGDDAELRARIESLLRAHDMAGGFLGDSGREQSSGRPDEAFATATRLDSITEKPGDCIGRYKLREKIGEGGCGVVYVAEQEEPVRRLVALKVIKLGMDTKQVIARFQAERQALALMDHPNIARVLDAGATDAGRPYFVMELVRGIKITDYCDQNNLSTREQLELFIQVCQAVQHAHQKGIIHRDLKPSNILVTLHDGVPVPKIIDFGIAKATEGRLTELTVYTELHQLIGTPAYMSPEQVEMSGLDIDTRSDIYSLGVLLYEMLTGEPPFNAKELLQSSLDQMRRTICEREPVRPSTRLSTMLKDELALAARRRGTAPPKLIHLVRGDLDWIVMKALEKDRTRRYETANGFASDIRRHLNNEPVVASPPGNLYRFQKWVRRNKLAFAAASAVTAALIIGLSVSLWLFVREKQAHQRAIVAEREQNRLRKAAEESEASVTQLKQAAEIREKEARRNAYVSDMIAASQAVGDGNLDIARQLLAGQVPRAGEEDLRTFEWRYLWNQSRGEQLATLLGHSNIVNCVAFSPDGRILASGSSDYTIKLWNPATGGLIHTCVGSFGDVVSLAFSKDGLILASGSEDSVVRFWDVRTWKITSTLTNFLPRVMFSPDGKTIAIATGGTRWAYNSGTVELWDYAAGRLLMRLPGSGNRAAFAPDGKMIATANGNGLVRLWEVATGTELRTFACARVQYLVFSPDGRFLAWSANNQIWLWDLSQDQPAILANSTQGTIYGVAFSPDGQTIASADQYHTITLWNVAHDKEPVQLQGHGSGVWDVAFSPDGKMLASGAQDNTVRLWNPLVVEASQEITGVFVGKDFSGNPIFSPDGKSLACPLVSGGILLSDVATGRAAGRLETSDLPVAFSSDGQNLITCDRSFSALQRWSPDTRMPLGKVRLATITTNLFTSDFSPDRNLMATGDRQNHVILRSMETGEVLFTLKIPGSAQVVVLSRNGYLAILRPRNSTQVWDLATRHLLFTLGGFNDWVNSCVFARDGRHFAAGSLDGTVKVADIPDQQHLTRLIGNRASISAVAFSSDGKTLATSADDNTVRLWNLATGREVLRFETGTIAFLLGFSPDDRTLAFGGMDHIIHLRRAPSIEEIDASLSARPETNSAAPAF